MFYSMNSGITITNDGSHFALFDALVETGSPELPQVRQFAFGDSAEYQGRHYSDRNPGLALSTYGLYQGLRGLEGAMQRLHLDPKFAGNYSRNQRDRIPIVMLLPALSAALVFVFTFLLVRDSGVGSVPSLLAALSILLGTICLRYGTVFYSHMFAAALLVSALWAIFRYVRVGSRVYLPIGIFALSLGVLVEHLLVIVFLPVALYLLFNGSYKRMTAAEIAAIVVAGITPMFILMAYNWVCFGSVFSIAHFHHATDVANHHLGTLLRFEGTLVATGNLLFGAPEAEVGRQDLLGLFSASPFLYFSLLAIPLAILGMRKFSKEDLVLFASIVLLILGGASVFAPYGGWDRDYRYFLAAIPLFAPSIGYVLDYLLQLAGKRFAGGLKYSAIAVFVVLVVVSIQAQVAHVRHPGQAQYPSLFINYQAALINVSLFFGFVISAGLLLIFLVACCRWIRSKLLQVP